MCNEKSNNKIIIAKIISNKLLKLINFLENKNFDKEIIRISVPIKPNSPKNCTKSE